MESTWLLSSMILQLSLEAMVGGSFVGQGQEVLARNCHFTGTCNSLNLLRHALPEWFCKDPKLQGTNPSVAGRVAWSATGLNGPQQRLLHPRWSGTASLLSSLRDPSAGTEPLASAKFERSPTEAAPAQI